MSSALTTRFSVRAYLDKPVERDVLDDLLKAAQQSPSGGNLQPWHVYATAGDDRDAFLEKIRKSIAEDPIGEPGGYDIYPPKLQDPYKARRSKCGEDMYAALGISREDNMARIQQVMKNFDFFGAPVGPFFRD